MKVIKRYLLLPVLLCLCMGAWADNLVGITVSDGYPGDEVTVSVTLNNSDVVSSLQISIPIDEVLSVVDGSGTPGSRCSSHNVTVGVKDGELQLFVFSNDMSAISGNSGVVATFSLKLGNLPGRCKGTIRCRGNQLWRFTYWRCHFPNYHCNQRREL